MSLHDRLIIDAAGVRWRVFAPSWRLWLWVGFLTRRLVVAALPGRLWPFVGWSPSRLLPVRVGYPARRVEVRVERVESRNVKVVRAWFRRGRSHR